MNSQYASSSFSSDCCVTNVAQGLGIYRAHFRVSPVFKDLGWSATLMRAKTLCPSHVFAAMVTELWPWGMEESIVIRLGESPVRSRSFPLLARLYRRFI